jgi:prepilin peptidase CpaA
MSITVSAIALVLLLGLAVIEDIRSRRIPNALVMSGVALAMALHSVALIQASASLAGPAWWSAIAGMAAGLALMLPLYALRAMGAGDVKLIAMVGAFIGPGAVVWAALCTLVAGGVLSIVYMLGRGVAAQTLNNLRALLIDWTVRAGSGQGIRVAPLENTAARLPYALAIALGTLASLLWPWAGA